MGGGFCMGQYFTGQMPANFKASLNSDSTQDAAVYADSWDDLTTTVTNFSSWVENDFCTSLTEINHALRRIKNASRTGKSEGERLQKIIDMNNKTKDGFRLSASSMEKKVSRAYKKWKTQQDALEQKNKLLDNNKIKDF